MPPLPTTAQRTQSRSRPLGANSWALSELFRRPRVEAMAVGEGQGGALCGGLSWIIGYCFWYLTCQRLDPSPSQEAQRAGGE